jgi:hypothetical protein
LRDVRKFTRRLCAQRADAHELDSALEDRRVLRADLGSAAPRQLRRAGDELIRKTAENADRRVAELLHRGGARPERFERFDFGVQ